MKSLSGAAQRHDVIPIFFLFCFVFLVPWSALPFVTRMKLQAALPSPERISSMSSLFLQRLSIAISDLLAMIPALAIGKHHVVAECLGVRQYVARRHVCVLHPRRLQLGNRFDRGLVRGAQ